MSPNAPIDSIPTPTLRDHALVVLGIALAVIQAIAYVVGLGSFEDGVQMPDVVLVVTTLIAALGTKTQVWSQRTVDALEPSKRKQREAIAKSRR